MQTSAWMASAVLAWGGRYAAGFCVGGFTEVDFAEVLEDFAEGLEDFDPCPEDNLLLQLPIYWPS